MSGRFRKQGFDLGDGDRAPAITFRLKVQDGQLYFSLWAFCARAPIFSGLVPTGFSDQLRALAAAIDELTPPRAGGG